MRTSSRPIALSASRKAPGARARNLSLFAGPFGPLYSFYMERERLARVIAWAVWGGDIRPFYASMIEVGRVPDGATIVDAPCGAGVALRGLRPEQQVRYVALDLSPAMLERARRTAARRGLRGIEFVEADATSIPIEDGAVDLFLSYWGLHCFADPEAAIAEIERCLAPGGRLIGSAITAGATLRHRLVWTPTGAPSG